MTLSIVKVSRLTSALLTNLKKEPSDGKYRSYSNSCWFVHYFGEGLNQHLQSRREVEAKLASTGIPVTTFRAAMIIGARLSII